MSMTSRALPMTSFPDKANLTTNDDSLWNSSVSVSDAVSAFTSHATAWPDAWAESDGMLITPTPNISTNQTQGLCDANDSQLWQLTYPVCTTRFHSIATFVAVAAVLTIITLWTILGNVLVLVALYKYKTLRTMSNCLIGNLAISDLLLAVTVLPVSTTNDLLGYWVFGDITCAFWLIMDVLYCTASVWGLCTVAFDRYMATAYPVWYHDKRSVKKAVGCVVFVWIFSIIISFAPFIGWQHMIPTFFTFNRELNRHECILFMSSSYVIYSSVGSFVIPTCLMTFMYIRIFKVLHRQSNNMKKKVQTRKPPRRRAVANGCPTILVPDAGDTEAVVRDFTTTTLVSMSAADGSLHSDDRDQDGTAFEREHLLNVPRVSLQSANGMPLCHCDVSCRLDEEPYALRDSDGLHRGDSTSVTKSASYDSTPSNGSLIMKTSFINNKPVTQDKLPRSPQKRSNSVCTMTGGVSPVPSVNHLNVGDMERRNSHEGTLSPRSTSDTSGTGNSLKVEGQATLLKPVCHRSKSANVLSSSDEDGSMHPTQKPRRSLPCDLTKLGRNNKMTLSMKRRFELREQRATKRMLLIMASFCVCWMPFVVMYITRSLCHDCDMNTHLVAAIIWLGYVNSSLNPVLYSLFNDDFKAAFKRLIGMKSPPPRGRR